MTYREDKNMGLPTTFVLTAGKFQLIGGRTKAQDNMRMIMHFVGWFREFYDDFCLDIYWLLQKPTSYIETFRNIYLNQFSDVIKKYARFIGLNKANLNFQGSDRKVLTMGVDYSFILEKEDSLQFVQIIN